MNNIPPITKNLIIINVLFFFAMLVGERYHIDLTNELGLHFFLASDFKIYQLFTYMFMHANITHILFNMFAVWMFGRVMESYWGGRRFLLYYIVCGVGAGSGCCGFCAWYGTAPGSHFRVQHIYGTGRAACAGHSAEDYGQ